MSENSLGISKENIKNIYDDATKEKQLFLFIDLDNPEFKYRKGLDSIYSVPTQGVS
jgi:hypothetical protein